MELRALSLGLPASAPVQGWATVRAAWVCWPLRRCDPVESPPTAPEYGFDSETTYEESDVGPGTALLFLLRGLKLAQFIRVDRLLYNTSWRAAWWTLVPRAFHRNQFIRAACYWELPFRAWCVDDGPLPDAGLSAWLEMLLSGPADAVYLLAREAFSRTPATLPAPCQLPRPSGGGKPNATH